MKSKSEIIEIVRQMQRDWDGSREQAADDAERLMKVVHTLYQTYTKPLLTMGDLIRLADALEVFNHDLTKNFEYIFVNKFVASWIDEVRKGDDNATD